MFNWNSLTSPLSSLMPPFWTILSQFYRSFGPTVLLFVSIWSFFPSSWCRPQSPDVSIFFFCSVKDRSRLASNSRFPYILIRTSKTRFSCTRRDDVHCCWHHLCYSSARGWAHLNRCHQHLCHNWELIHIRIIFFTSLRAYFSNTILNWSSMCARVGTGQPFPNLLSNFMQFNIWSTFESSSSFRPNILTIILGNLVSPCWRGWIWTHSLSFSIIWTATWLRDSCLICFFFLFICLLSTYLLIYFVLYSSFVCFRFFRGHCRHCQSFHLTAHLLIFHLFLSLYQYHHSSVSQAFLLLLLLLLHFSTSGTAPIWTHLFVCPLQAFCQNVLNRRP